MILFPELWLRFLLLAQLHCKSSSECKSFERRLKDTSRILWHIIWCTTNEPNLPEQKQAKYKTIYCALYMMKFNHSIRSLDMTLTLRSRVIKIVRHMIWSITSWCISTLPAHCLHFINHSGGGPWTMCKTSPHCDSSSQNSNANQKTYYKSNIA